MNEYRVTVIENGEPRSLMLQAPSAAAARDLAEEQSQGEVQEVRFLRAASFSCAIRDGR